MTRPGIEGGPNVTKRRPVTVAPTDSGALERPAVVSRCNECNEALHTARAAIADARRLALIAQNALINGDVQRANTALRDLYEVTSGERNHPVSAGFQAAVTL